MLQRRPLPSKDCRTSTPLERKDFAKWKLKKEQQIANLFHENSWDVIKSSEQVRLEIANSLKPKGPGLFPTRDVKTISDNSVITNREVDYSYDLPYDWLFFGKDEEPNDENVVESIADEKSNEKVLHILNLNESENLPNVLPRKPWRQLELENMESNFEEGSQMKNLIINEEQSHRPSEQEEFSSESEMDEEEFETYNVIKRLSGEFDMTEEAQLKDELLNEAFIMERLKERKIYDEDVSVNIKGYFVEVLPIINLSYLCLVRYVNLSFNYFTEIPKQLFRAKHLETLIMRNNPIVQLSPNVGEMKNLKFLNLSFCRLESLKNICSLLNLRALDVSYNGILEIDDDIKNLWKLQELNVDGNFIGMFPKGLTKLSRLENFKCDTNFIHKIFWKTSAPKTVLSLVDLSRKVIVENGLCSKDTLSKEKFPNCHFCNRVKPYKGLAVIKPIIELFGIENLPIVFYVCSQLCRKKLLNAARIPNF